MTRSVPRLHGTKSNTRPQVCPIPSKPLPRHAIRTLIWQGKSKLNSKLGEKNLVLQTNSKAFLGSPRLMLVAFGEQGIKTMEDLAGCATDDLCGWIEDTSERLTRHEGVLHRFNVSRRECDAMILDARGKAGWI